MKTKGLSHTHTHPHMPTREHTHPSTQAHRLLKPRLQGKFFSTFWNENSLFTIRTYHKTQTQVLSKLLPPEKAKVGKQSSWQRELNKQKKKQFSRLLVGCEYFLSILTKGMGDPLIPPNTMQTKTKHRFEITHKSQPLITEKICVTRRMCF